MSESPASSTDESSPNSKFKLASKYAGLEDNVWVTICSIAKPGIVNLGQGFPDFNPAPDIIKHLSDICQPEEDYRYHQYAREFGHPRLVNALAKLYGPLISRQIDPMNEVLITGGAYGALYFAVMSNVGPGDEVIIIEPFFDCYAPLVQLAGGSPVYVALKPDANANAQTAGDMSSDSWKLDMNEFEALFNRNTKAIILNTPNNPLGKVFTRNELNEIAKLCKQHDVLVISDEVYEFIVYDEHEHVRIASLEGMWNRTLTIGSAGKAFSLTGWKLGWVYGPKHLMHNLRVAHQNCTYMCHTPEQEALGRALEIEIGRLGTPESYFARLKNSLYEKRQLVVGMIKASGMKPIVPSGGYFILTDWTTIKEKVNFKTILQNKSIEKESPDFHFVRWLAHEKKLLGIPPSAFYTPDHQALAHHYIRFNFFKKEETLRKAEEILKTIKDL